MFAALLGCSEPPVAPRPPIVVELTLTGFSPQYREHLSDPDALRALGEALAPCSAGPAQLGVSYEAFRGVATLAGPWRPACRPGPDGDLAPVQVLGRALAAWRDALAVRYDRRLASFTCRIDLGDDCAVELAGQLPPDGSTFAACPRCPIAATAAEAGCATGSAGRAPGSPGSPAE